MSSLPKQAPVSLFLLLIVLLVACQGPNGAEGARLTGFLTTATVDMAPESGGRLLTVTVAEGDAVTAGQVLARLDDTPLQLEIAQAEAAVAEAEARLALVRAGARPVDRDVAAAQVAYARAALAAAEVALADAERLRDRPQQADLAVAVAESALAEAEARARAARLVAQAADHKAEMWGVLAADLAKGVDIPLPGGGTQHLSWPDKAAYAQQQWNLSSQEAWAAWQESAAADAAVAQARTALVEARRQRAAAQEATDRVVAAQNARDEAAARLEQAEKAYEALVAGPSPEQMAAAEAAVVQAQAAVAALKAQRERFVLKAPVDGIVIALYRRAGEVIGPRQRLLTVSQPNALELTVYAPAWLLPTLQPGQQLPVEVEAIGNRRFPAEVLRIADRPEFTLRQAQNVAERGETTYAVTLRLLEADPLLRPGMPAVVVMDDR
ncbi:MAG: biotin/lipoyl-binding protein [Anaerolineae bacterium]|nr:biotin/lipoyl-binding protein [Anaerolineae bacterium]